MKKCLLFIFCLIVFQKVEAQFYVGNEVGLIGYDIQDEFINNYRYEVTTASFFTPSLLYRNSRSFFQVRFNTKSATAEIADVDDFQAKSVMKFQNYILEFEYFHKIIAFNSYLDAYAGISHNGHFTYINRTFNTRYYNSESETHEMGALVFSVNGMLEFTRGKNRALYKAGIGFLNYGSRPDYQSGNIDMRFFSFGEYIRLHNSLSCQVELSDRMFLKPEYLLTYYTFKNPERMKMLKQSFMLGIYLQLW